MGWPAASEELYNSNLWAHTLLAGDYRFWAAMGPCDGSDTIYILVEMGPLAVSGVLS